MECCGVTKCLEGAMLRLIVVSLYFPPTRIRGSLGANALAHSSVDENRTARRGGGRVMVNFNVDSRLRVGMRHDGGDPPQHSP